VTHSLKYVTFDNMQLMKNKVHLLMLHFLRVQIY